MIEGLFDLIHENNPFFIMLAGLAIGLIHAFEPDHLSAVSAQLTKHGNRTFSSKKQRLGRLTISSSFRGMVWGIGHTSSVVLMGLLIAGLSLHIPDNFFIGAEFIVGFMLIFLGILTVKKINIFKQKHIHPHTHANGVHHTHHHSHDDDHNHGHKAYLIGCLHGLAGSGALVALVASTVTGFDMILYFLILFGMGSIIGMTVASGIIGLPFILFSKINIITKYLKYSVATITIVIGIGIVVTLTFGFTLF